MPDPRFSNYPEVGGQPLSDFWDDLLKEGEEIIGDVAGEGKDLAKKKAKEELEKRLGGGKKGGGGAMPEDPTEEITTTQEPYGPETPMQNQDFSELSLDNPLVVGGAVTGATRLLGMSWLGATLSGLATGGYMYYSDNKKNINNKLGI